MNLEAKANITAYFQFNRFGRLIGVFLNAENEEDQKILEKGLFRFLKPGHLNILKRLFGVTNGR